MTMRDTIARAIADHREPESATFREIFVMLLAKAGSTQPADRMDTLFLDLADAVLAAMREPDEAMVEAGRDPFFDMDSEDVGSRPVLAAIWQAMIDAATQDK